MKEKWNSYSVDQKILVGSVCSFLVFVVIMGLVMWSSNMDFKKVFKANEATILELTSQLSLMEEPVVQDKDTATENLKSCASAGTMIASYQNSYANMENSDERTEVARQIKSYMKDNSQRTAWYYGTAPHEWKFHSTYDFADTDIEVLWTCKHTETGELLAYATGHYDALDEAFYSTDVYITSVGDNYYDAD